MSDTICAIATCVGQSSINIIRISGYESIKIVNEVFDRNLLNIKSNTITYGHIIEEKTIIDEVLVSVFRAPKSFTTEDVVEINTHGGIMCVNKIMTLLQEKGCRLAEPGEFTKRAFLNGRISLTEAEAISDLINAQNEKNRVIASKALNKEIYKVITELKNKITPLIGNIEVNIDYPEYEDAEEITRTKVRTTLKEVFIKINELVDSSEKGLMIKNGLNIAIVGRPNVGKSSILNAILKEKKAIVTNIEGTTRDIVEGKISLCGIEVTFYDTAGIRKTNNPIEKIGVEKSYKTIETADLILFVIDSLKLNKEDKLIFKNIKDKKVLIVLNKIDKIKKIKTGYFGKELEKFEIVEISALEEINIDKLKDVIEKLFKIEDLNNDYTYISNSRQIALLKKCSEIGKNIENAIDSNLPIDMIEIDVKQLWETLGEINGETYKEELLDEIFSRFCLGK